MSNVIMQKKLPKPSAVYSAYTVKHSEELAIKIAMKDKLSVLLKFISTSVVAVLIGACASFDSPYQKKLPAKTGSDIQINITADIPLHLARVYSQKGRLIARSDIDTKDVLCSVLMNKLQQENGVQLSISPGKFRVTRVRFSNDKKNASWVFTPREFLDPPSIVNYQTELRLESVSQPEVRSLICVRQVDGYGERYPGPLDFKNALGTLVEFNQSVQ